MSVRALVSMLAVIATVQARPQLIIGGAATAQAINQGIDTATRTGAALLQAGFATSRAIGEQVRDISVNAWNAGTQGLLAANNAVRTTAVGSLQGVRSLTSGVGDFGASAIRSGGTLAAGTLRGSFNAAQSVSNSASQLAAGVSRSAIQSSITATQAGNAFAQTAASSAGNFAIAANDAARDVVVGGFRSLSNSLSNVGR